MRSVHTTEVKILTQADLAQLEGGLLHGKQERLNFSDVTGLY